ncbi:MAG: WYL domain-containing protein [Planctomycetaceae bacterium]
MSEPDARRHHRKDIEDLNGVLAVSGGQLDGEYNQRWPSQHGSLIAEFQLTATEEIKAWVLSFGAKAEVLEPPSLREEMARDLAQSLVAHQKRPEPVPGIKSRQRRSPK